MPGVAYAYSPGSPKSKDLMTGIRILNSKEVIQGDCRILDLGHDISYFFKINYFFTENTSPLEVFLNTPHEVYRDDLFKLGWKKNPRKEVVLEFSLRIFFTNNKEFNLSFEVFSIREF